MGVPINTPRREHVGGANPAHLAASLPAAGLALTADDLTGWPSGSIGQFVATIARGTPGEERVLCQSRTGNTVTVAVRGWDGTSPLDHAVQETFEHTDSATEFDEANVHITSTVAHGQDLENIDVAAINGLQTALNDRYTKAEANAQFIDAGEIAAILPAGMIMPTARADEPAGWLLCWGQAVSRTTYAALFAAIGVQFGAGNGTTTFTLPNLKGRAPFGIDTAQAEFNTRGKVGGAKTVALSATHMPAHNHGLTGAGGASADDITVNFTELHATAPSSTAYQAIVAGQLSGRFTKRIDGMVQVNHQHSIPAQGANTPFTNLSPYLSLNYLIKT